MAAGPSGGVGAGGAAGFDPSELAALSRDLKSALVQIPRAIRGMHKEAATVIRREARSTARGLPGTRHFARQMRLLGRDDAILFKYNLAGGPNPSRRGKTGAAGWLLGGHRRQFAPWLGTGWGPKDLYGVGPAVRNFERGALGDYATSLESALSEVWKG